jgi:tetratricopeptide (TPR) repeat protein
MRILLALWIASILPGMAAQALVNRAALGCMADAVGSRFRDAALLGRPAEGQGGCSAARRLTGSSDAAVRWSAIGELTVGNYQRAHDRLSQSAPTANEAVLQHFFLGLASHALGRSDEAIREWSSLDDNGRVLLAIAERLVVIGHPDAALPYCYAAAAAQPDSVDVRFRLAEALSLAGRVDDALAEYRQAFASGSLPAITDFGDAAFHYAQLLGARRRFAESIAMMQVALEARPRYAIYMGFLAVIYTQAGDPTQAVRWLDEAVKAAPASGYPYWEYGRFYMSRQMTAQAIEQFERAVRLDPAGPAYYYADLGAAYLTANRRQPAIDALREACRRAPANAMYRQWLGSAESAAPRQQ